MTDIKVRNLDDSVATALRSRQGERRSLKEEVLGIAARGALRLHRDQAVIRSALALSIAHQQKVPNCLFLALAEDTGAGLANADLRLNEIARVRQLLTILVPSA